MADPGPTVNADDRTSAGVATLQRWVDLAAATLRAEGVTTGGLDLIFVDEDEMAGLNEAHMGSSGPTDVLAFPLDAADDDPFDLVSPGDPIPVHLGDVVVCPAVAARQAPEHCGSDEAELSLLIIHGVLHVLGHDHAEPEETEVMRARERHHLDGLGFAHPEPV